MSAAPNGPTPPELNGSREEEEEEEEEIVRELVESLGFFAGACLFVWGVLGPNGATGWLLILMWPLFAFVLPIVGPRRFRTVLMGIGIAVLIASGITRSFNTAAEIRFILGAEGLLLSALFLTPRTQGVLAATSVALAGSIVWLYVGSFFFWESEFSSSSEPDLANAGLLLVSPLMLLMIMALLIRTRAYIRAGRAGIWHRSLER